MSPDALMISEGVAAQENAAARMAHRDGEPELGIRICATETESELITRSVVVLSAKSQELVWLMEKLMGLGY
jgi:hypothetical protein